MNPVLVQAIAFQVVWFSCALGGAQGTSLPGVLAAAGFLGAHAWRVRPARAHVRLVAAALAMGWILDTAMVGFGWIVFPGPPSHSCARARAQESASVQSERSRRVAWRSLATWSLSTAALVSAMRGNVTCPSRKAATATSIEPAQSLGPHEPA